MEEGHTHQSPSAAHKRQSVETVVVRSLRMKKEVVLRLKKEVGEVAVKKEGRSLEKRWLAFIEVRVSHLFSHGCLSILMNSHLHFVPFHCFHRLAHECVRLYLSWCVHEFAISACFSFKPFIPW
jgi:hypothetical protein